MTEIVILAHTPGPWSQNVLIVQDSHGQQIAHCTRWESGAPKPEVAEANARLIAAAPDLLDALVTIVQSVTNDSDACVFCRKDVYFHDRDCPVLFAVKALAKAEGAR